ncbi:Y' element ATP-dependent helicase YJL225C-like isoform X1 [Homarus americanus]|uniref:Y' element ATP-dependent helicase YJL225C-like isoform X1 n=1 Tax=Homarus americanus TaxID=6706 RepID=UPI001C43C697|nr:Y' element ATP-dependent helicase YJL225C-like isoform X1 [Homarus americanus]
MADEAARRRELRRRRILDNAEERKRKIFGVSNAANGTTVTDELQNSEEPGNPTVHSVLAPQLHSNEEAVTNKTCCINSSPSLNNDLDNATTSNNNSRESTIVNARESINVNKTESTNVNTSESTNDNTSESTNDNNKESTNDNNKESTYDNNKESTNINTRESPHVDTRENTHVNARESIHINARESIHGNARESIHVNARESIHVNARESIHVNQTILPNSSRIQNGSIPDLTEQLMNLNRLITANGGISPSTVQNGRPQQDVQPVASVEPLYTSMVPVVLALLVCTLLSFNLGYIVSNSISIPFILWEAHHLWCQRYAIHACSRSGAGLMGIAFMLCGVRQSTVVAYAHLLTIVKCFIEDFALYLLSVVLWCTVIGLPGVVQPESLESSHPMAQREVVVDDEDMFHSVEDF